MITPKRHRTAEEYPIATLVQHFQHTLTPTQLHIFHYLLLALLTLGTLAQTRVCLLLANLTALASNTWRQRLKRLRQQPFPEQTLFPTLRRRVVAWLRLPEVFLALDATTLGNRWTVLALGVVVHQHTIPVAWKVVRGNTKGAWLPWCEQMLALLQGALPKAMPVYVLTDRGLWSPELYAAIERNRWHPLMRTNAQGNFRPCDGKVGIGTSSPTERLHVVGNIRLADDSSIFGLDRLVGFNDLRLFGDATGGPDLYISSAGNVGIGTSSPAARLDVSGGNAHFTNSGTTLQILPNTLFGTSQTNTATLEIPGNGIIGVWDALRTTGDLNVGGGLLTVGVSADPFSVCARHRPTCQRTRPHRTARPLPQTRRRTGHDRPTHAALPRL
jgi:hypothetical protein